MIKIKWTYEPVKPSDGYWVLADRQHSFVAPIQEAVRQNPDRHREYALQRARSSMG
jgi:hypothetical protein